jgi:hypothetical protein
VSYVISHRHWVAAICLDHDHCVFVHSFVQHISQSDRATEQFCHLLHMRAQYVSAIDQIFDHVGSQLQRSFWFIDRRHSHHPAVASDLACFMIVSFGFNDFYPAFFC